MLLKGKTAVISGAASKRGIGLATARLFAEQGARVAILDLDAKAACRQIREAGAETEALSANLSQRDGIQAFRDHLNDVCPDVDILINNAGSLVKRASLVEFSEELFDEVMDLNFRAPWFIAQECAPNMIQRGWGRIVNVSSIAARHGGGPGATIYAASKAAVSAATKGMAKELAPRGIRVNAVSPGTVDNHFHEVFSTDEMMEAMRKATPAGKLGTDEEVADVVVFLCSDAARFIYGQTIEINGGMFMI